MYCVKFDKFPPNVQHFPSSSDGIRDEFYVPKSCWDAACFRNIGLDDELKTLIFSTKLGLCVFHLLGHCNLDIGKVKDMAPGIRLSSKKQLDSARLKKGRINPFNLEGLSNQLHMIFICSLIFKKDFLYTNDGTSFGTIKFNPYILQSCYKKSIINNYGKVAYFGVDSSIEINNLGNSNEYCI